MGGRHRLTAAAHPEHGNSLARTGFERARTSLFKTGAGDGNRTRIISLEGWGSTIELLPPGSHGSTSFRGTLDHKNQTDTEHLGGGGWIRTSVGVSQQIYSLPPLTTR